jgi:hypothetical protein
LRFSLPRKQKRSQNKQRNKKTQKAIDRNSITWGAVCSAQTSCTVMLYNNGNLGISNSILCVPCLVVVFYLAKKAMLPYHCCHESEVFFWNHESSQCLSTICHLDLWLHFFFSLYSDNVLRHIFECKDARNILVVFLD